MIFFWERRVLGENTEEESGIEEGNGRQLLQTNLKAYGGGEEGKKKT